MRHLTSNRRKTLNKLVQRIIVLQVLEERLYGNPGTSKNRRASQDFGINRDKRIGRHISRDLYHQKSVSASRRRNPSEGVAGLFNRRLCSPVIETPRQSEAATDLTPGLRGLCRLSR